MMNNVRIRSSRFVRLSVSYNAGLEWVAVDLLLGEASQMGVVLAVECLVLMMA